MSDRRQKRRPPMTGIFVVSIEDRDLFRLVAALLVCLLLALVAFAVAQDRTNTAQDSTNARLDTNASKIAANTRRIARQARSDVARSRRADARQCARENLVRAEVHVAYQQKQPMPAPEAFAREPILRVLLVVNRARQVKGLTRVRRNLPILECSPNLRGDAAYPLTPRQQGRFVELYKAGRLKPVPSARDAATGPDELKTP